MSTSTEKPLSGRTAIVTGGARGIGRAYAVRLRNLGADVAALDLSFDGSTENSPVLGIVCDLSSPDEVRAAVDKVKAAFGQIDVLVCNAGGSVGPYAETTASAVTVDRFESVLERNLWTTVNAVQAVSQSMREQKYGRIVTVSSLIAGRVRLDGGNAHYAAVKSAVSTYTRYIARELGPWGVTANCLVPGYIGTERLMPMFEQFGVDEMLKAVPMQRLGTTEDCANALEFLVGPLGSYINGVTLEVDGGASL